MSRNSSFRFDAQTSLGGPVSPPVSGSSGKGEKTGSVFRSLMSSLKQRSEAEDEAGCNSGSESPLERLTSKHSRR